MNFKNNFFIILISVLCIQNNYAKNCPEYLLKNFKVDVSSKDVAQEVFKQYFTQEKGFPPFDPTKVKIDKSPSCSQRKEVKTTCYFYYDFYGMGPSGVGGYLYPNGKLVKRGYCK